MKVFEVMSLLAECPAGAEVEFHALMPIDELIKDGPQMELEGKPNYSLCKNTAEVEDNENGTVYLYSD